MSRGSRDEFEDRFMHDGAPVVHRDKQVSRAMALLLALPAVITLTLAAVLPFINPSSDKPVPAEALPFVIAGLIAFSFFYVVLAITFAILRVVVTDRNLVVRYGLWGPKVPLDAITDCRVVDYQWTKYGGWGIRRGVDGSWAYVVRGGKVVELCWREGREQKKALVGAQNPEALVSQVQKARAALGGRRLPPPIDQVEVTRDDEAAEEEAEAERPMLEPRRRP
jgi:hypothetical protein